MKTLCESNGKEWFELVKNKTLRVVSLEYGQTVDKKLSDFTMGNIVYKGAKFPIFEIID